MNKKIIISMMVLMLAYVFLIFLLDYSGKELSGIQDLNRVTPLFLTIIAFTLLFCSYKFLITGLNETQKPPIVKQSKGGEVE